MLISIICVPLSCIFAKWITLVACFVCLCFMVSYMAGMIICRYLPYSWTCEWAGTHRPSTESSFDGCSQHSTCYKCGKAIMQDSQGGWF